MNDEISTKDIQRVIEKLQTKGFEALSLEELGIAVSTKDFDLHFKRVTG